MKKRLKKITKPLNSYCLLVFLILGLGSFSASAQGNSVTGKVVSSDGMGIPGANVIQKGSKNGVMTNMDGEYTIKLLPGTKTLVVSYIGYGTKEVVVGNKSVINIILQSDSKELDEVVVIGYGTAKKRDVLGSTGNVKAAQIMQFTPNDALDALQGQVAGVQILSNGGPGAGSEIVIRGLSTLNAGVGPLYVVDGQQMDNIDNIDPSSIESMDILKDGASAAIYGSKSANGVILITTKSGKLGFPKIDVSYTNTYSYVSSFVPIANVKQYKKANELRANPGEVFTKHADSLGVQFQLVDNLQDILFRTAVSTQANIGISGGNDNINYSWNTSILDQTGVYIGSSYQRITSAFKTDINVSKRLTMGFRTNLGYNINQGDGDSGGLTQATYKRPDVLVYNYDGSYRLNILSVPNPVISALEVENTKRNFSASIFNYAEYSILPSLKFKSTLGVNYGYQKRNRFVPEIAGGFNVVGGVPVPEPGNRINGFERDGLSYDILQQNYLNFNKKIGKKHSITALLGMEYQFWRSENTNLFATKFNNDIVRTYNNVNTFDLSRTNTTASSHALASFFSRLSYDYNGKYFINGTIRRDGSSRFGTENKWGNFPSVAAGWRISKEPFMKSIKVISDFKLRASYGVTGNEQIGDFEYQSLVNVSQAYNGVGGVAPTNKLGNDKLGWESTTTRNYGVDLSFFKNRLNFSLDYYTKNTTDLLYDVPVPEELGATTVQYNVGSVLNKGIELDIKATPINTKNFRWVTSFNIGFNKNEVTQLNNSEAIYPNSAGTSIYKVEVGQPIGNFFVFKNLGVFQYDQSNAFANIDGKQIQLTPNFNGSTFVNYTLNGEVYTGTVGKKTFGANNLVLKGGDINWEDTNNDNRILLENDRQILGNGTPKYSGGLINNFNYKNLSLSFLVNFNLGHNIFRYYDYFRDRIINPSVVTSSPQRIDEAWVKQGDIAAYPSLIRNDNNTAVGSNYIGKGDYIRLKNIKFGYSLTKEALKEIKIINSLTFSLTVTNILTLTNYTGYNPELGNNGNSLTPGYDNIRYPNKTDIIFGLTTQF